MFYRIAFNIVKFVIYLLNGKPKYDNLDKLPEGNYILVAPHKTWWDPLYLAIAGLPKQYSFMAKKEIFKNKFVNYILDKVHVFPVDRENPGPSAVKIPINYLKKTDLSLIMFPSGTRYSEDLKGGVALIAKMAKVPIVPAIYEGPMKMTDLLKRHKATIKIGDPIDISDIKKINKDGIAEVEHRINQQFSQLKQQ